MQHKDWDDKTLYDKFHTLFNDIIQATGNINDKLDQKEFELWKEYNECKSNERHVALNQKIESVEKNLSIKIDALSSKVGFFIDGCVGKEQSKLLTGHRVWLWMVSAAVLLLYSYLGVGQFIFKMLKIA